MASDWTTVVIEGLGVAGTAFAGPVSAHWSLSTAKKLMKNDDRRAAAVELVDAQTNYGNYMLDLYSAQRLNRSPVHISLVDKPVIERLQSAMDRAPLLMSDDAFDAIVQFDREAASLFEQVTQTTAQSPPLNVSEQMDDIHNRMLKVLHSDLA